MSTKENLLGTSIVTHIAIVVRDIEATAAAVAKLIGSEIPPINLTGGPEEAHTMLRGEPTEGRAKLCFFPLGHLTLELIEPDEHPSVWREHLDKHGSGIHHIAFQVKGMDDRIKALEGCGAKLAQRGDYKGGRYAYVDATEPLGMVLELLEDESWLGE